MAVTISNQIYDTAGSQRKVTARITLDNSYPTGGYTLTAAQFAMSRFTNILSGGADGYQIDFGSFASQPSSILMPVYSGASGTTGATSGGTPAGSVAAPVFTGNALAVHGHNVQITQDEVLSVTAGTGVSSALANIPVGSVDNVYITAGGVTGAAVIVPTGSVANTKEVSINYTTGVLQFLVADAVTGAKVTYARAAVSTTSAGTPAGTNSAPAFTGNLLATHTHSVGAAAGGEVTNGTNLSAVSFEIEAYGY